MPISVPVPPRLVEDMRDNNARNLKLFLENVRERLNQLQTELNEIIVVAASAEVDAPEIVDFTGAGPHLVQGTHDGKILRVTHTTACTLTLPQTSTAGITLPFMIGVIQGGVGQLTVAVQGSDVLESSGSVVTLYGRHSVATINKRIAGSPNTWLLAGDIA